MARKKYNDDDGRQVADVSEVDVTMFGFATTRLIRKKKKTEKEKAREDKLAKEVLTLTKRETRRLTFRAMWISLLIGLVFVVLAGLLLLFMQYVWFR